MLRSEGRRNPKFKKRQENMETCGLKNGTMDSSIWEGN